ADDLARYAYSFLGTPSDAEDAVQTTLLNFIKAVQKGNYHGGNGLLKPYLKTCLRNECLTQIRKRGRLVEWNEYDAHNLNHHIEHQTPLHWIDQEQLNQKINETLLSLPDLERAAVMMRIYDELPYGEIAQALGVNIDHVKNLLFRARKKIQQSLSESNVTKQVMK
ncbi:RNA polymerase sigma factor, partial [bacterium]|nr:RNA polymerase sigma factor [bacterium]